MSETVYVNDNPIGETEVYHAKKGHVTTLRRWSGRHIRETTADEALDEGLRPCKTCFPQEAGRHCPSCGHPPGDGYENSSETVHEFDCNNENCRVQVFRTDRSLHTDRSQNDSKEEIHE